MNIEKGDLFIVTRGIKLANTAAFSFAFGLPAPADSDEPRYDRSWIGYVFRALEVCGDGIAAEVVHADADCYRKPGYRLQLVESEMTLFPVTQAYLEALHNTKGT